MATNIAIERPRAAAQAEPRPAPERRREWRTQIAEIRREVRARVEVSAYEGARPVASIALALGGLAIILLAGAGVILLHGRFGFGASLPAYVLAALLIARQQRTLELLVHDGSHRAFSRNRRVNNVLCDLFAASPVLQSAAAYAATHLVHHSQFGSANDPCRDRASMMILKAARGKGGRAWARAVLSALPIYLREYYGSVASSNRRVVAACIVWHATAAAILACFVGAGLATFAWLLFWAVPFTAVLPVLRMQAEADEHDYDAGCEALGTFTNFGVINRLLVHPASDQYHLAHHLAPSISLTQLARFDREARAKCPKYAAMPVRHR